MRVQDGLSTRIALPALVAILALTGPGLALATHQPNHAGGTGGTAAVTEDTDSDGVANNIPDEGDNLHPSGRDRSVESGGSGDQGRSASTPDQNGTGPERDIGGTDKPKGPGGADIIDQDRNNGCGNDDDFDDDNEGWCGKQKVAEKPASAAKSNDEGKPEGAGKPEDDVLGVAVGQAGSQPGAVGVPGGLLPGAGQPGTKPPGQVLGEVVVQGVAAGNVLAVSEERGSAAAALALTGGPLAALLLVAVVLLLVGGVLLTRSRVRPPSR